MSTTRLVREGFELLRKRGAYDTTQEARAFLREAVLRKYYQHVGESERGEPIYEQEWDVLILLDACRLDFMREVAPEYEFIQTVGEFNSLGSYSESWMERNFTDEYADEMAETVHVTANPFSELALEPEWFHELDEVWKYAWDDTLGTLPPRPLTDRAISLARERSPERMIVHYMQPHAPFTQHSDIHPDGISLDEWGSMNRKSIWQRVREGEVALSRVQDAYRAELRHVLDDVGLLLDNLDADRVVISSDHGELMGELGIYGHARGIACDHLRLVPWIPTTATDTGAYEPPEYDTTHDGNTTGRLSDLWYV